MRYVARPGSGGGLALGATALGLLLLLGIYVAHRGRAMSPGTRGRGRLILMGGLSQVVAVTTGAACTILALATRRAAETGLTFTYEANEVLLALDGWVTSLLVVVLVVGGMSSSTLRLVRSPRGS